MKYDNIYEEYYTNQAGGEFAVFSGPVLQRGRGSSSIFKSLFRFIRPIMSAVKPIAKRAAPVIGRQLLDAGSNVVQDLSEGKNLSTSVKSRLKEAGSKLGEAALHELTQTGSGIKRKRKQKSRHSTKRRRRSKTELFT